MSLRQLLRQLRREPERSHIEEWLAVDEPEIDPPRPARRDDAGGGVEVRRNSKGPGEIVRGSDGEDAERQTRLDHAERRGIDGAVAAADDDEVDLLALLDDERRQVFAALAVPVDGFDSVRFQALRRAASSFAAPLRLFALTMRRARRGHR